ncbi:MAG: hypothetical protein IT355_14110 [Gemmatimonadaceae bacterium]|nr:hypothetical protein [Gemmatimonadaceae bacterium]
MSRRCVRTIACLVLSLLAASGGAGAQRLRPDAAQASGSQLTITVQGVAYTLRLPPAVRVDMDTLEVLDAREVAGAQYLLLSVNGPSKRKGFGAGACGAGYETAIVWLRLVSWRLVASRSELVESCWQNRIIEVPLTWAGDSGTLTYQQLGAGAGRRVVCYDRGAPELGVVVTGGRR